MLIAPSPFYAGRNRPPSVHQQSDKRLLEAIKRAFYEYFAVYGVRKSLLQDGFSSRILGLLVATSKSAELVTRVLEQAVNVLRRSDPWFTAEGIIVHSGAGSQLTSLAFSQKLLDHSI